MALVLLQSWDSCFATSCARHSLAMETLIAFLMLCIVQSDMMWSVLQSKTITYAMLQAEATVISAAILLFFLSCVVTMLQSRMLLFLLLPG